MKKEHQVIYEENKSGLARAQFAIARMAKAHKNGKGVRLSWEELDDFSRTFIGEWFNEPNPEINR